MIYRFDSIEIDHDAYVLRRDGVAVHMRPKLLDVLVYLIEHRDRVVSHDELLERYWNSDVSAKSSVHWAVSKIRTALDQGGRQASPIETVPRRGYRFVGVLEVSASAPSASATPRAAATAQRSPGSPGSTPTLDGWGLFVGRSEILATLHTAWERTCDGHGGLHVLIGEPGIGKSRSAHEFAGRLPGPELAWTGLCGDTSSAPPLWPWLQVLRACAQSATERSWIQQESESLLAAVERRPLQTGSGPVAARSVVLLDRMRALLLSATKDAPRLVVLDDLSDADEASLDLLLLVMQRLAVSRLMVVATLRRATFDAHGDGDPRLRRICAGAHCIEVPPWSRDEVAEFVRRSAPGTPDARWMTYLWQHSGGNPLYLQELLRLDRVHGAAPLGPSELGSVVGRRAIPDAVQELVRCRIQDLPEATLAVLEVASVIGRSFELALVERVSEQTGTQLLTAVDVALRAGLIAHGHTPSHYVFRHDVMRDAIYAELAGTRRARLHGAVGEALEDPAFGPLVPSVLAWHFYCAAPLAHADKAVDYALRAARHAQRIDAYGDAVRYCEWALESQAFCRELSTERRCELRIELGTAQLEFGDALRGRRHLIRAIEIAEAQHLPRVLARAGLKLRHAILLSAAPDPIAQRVLEEARRELPEGEYALRSRVASHLACMPPYRQRPHESRALIDEAFSLAERAQSTTGRIDAQRAACQLRTGPDHAAELLDIATELERSAEQSGARRAAIEGQLYRYLALIQLGRLHEAAEIVSALAGARSGAVQRELDGLVPHLVARTSFAEGRIDEAIERYEALRTRRRRRPSGLGEFHWLAGMTLVHLERGTSAELWPLFMERTLLWRGRSAALRAMSLRLLVATGRHAEAHSILEAMPAELAHRSPLVPGQLGVLAHLALVAAALGEQTWCRALYDALAGRASLHAVDLLWFSLGSVEYFLGVLAVALGDPHAARVHFEAAIKSNAAAGHLPQTAWSRYQLARLIAEAPDRASRTSAAHLLAEAGQAADRMGLRALADAIQRAR